MSQKKQTVHLRLNFWDCPGNPDGKHFEFDGILSSTRVSKAQNTTSLKDEPAEETQGLTH